MELKIKDGKGRGYEAGVNSTGKLLIEGDTLTQFQFEILNSNGYNLSTGVPETLTNASESVVFYLKNNEDLPLVIKEVLVILGDSTGGAGGGLARVYKNPTAGSIIDNAVVATQGNRDWSSAKTLTVDLYKGVQGDTITASDGVFGTTSRSNFSDPIRFDAEIIVLRKGNSIAVSWQPPTSNTSQTCVIAATVILETTEI